MNQFNHSLALPKTPFINSDVIKEHFIVKWSIVILLKFYFFQKLAFANRAKARTYFCKIILKILLVESSNLAFFNSLTSICDIFGISISKMKYPKLCKIILFNFLHFLIFLFFYSKFSGFCLWMKSLGFRNFDVLFWIILLDFRISKFLYSECPKIPSKAPLYCNVSGYKFGNRASCRCLPEAEYFTDGSTDFGCVYKLKEKHGTLVFDHAKWSNEHRSSNMPVCKKCKKFEEKKL